MKNYLTAFFCILFSAGSCAQAIKAEDLEKLCTANTDSERISCSLIVKAYMDGFIEGVGKGAMEGMADAQFIWVARTFSHVGCSTNLL